MTAVPDRPEATLLALYDRALPQVYGYLLARCGDKAVAEDLTSETFLAMAGAADPATLQVGWLIGLARHKLVDHSRRVARQQCLLEAVEGSSVGVDDPWDVKLDRLRAMDVLTRVLPQHRAALTLRYLDGLAVPEVAGVLEADPLDRLRTPLPHSHPTPPLPPPCVIASCEPCSHPT